jgi:chemotaxis response regulator CheB
VRLQAVHRLDRLAEIMARQPTPVVMVSSLTERNTLVTLEALELGAIRGPACIATSRRVPGAYALVAMAPLVSRSAAELPRLTRIPAPFDHWRGNT